MRLSVLCLAGLALAGPAFADSISLTGTVRDFRGRNEAGGHMDFEGLIADDRGIVLPTLGVDGKPVYAGLAGNPTTSGQANFDQWYRDVSGVNMTSSLTLTANETFAGSGIYQYSNNSFFPIDGQGFGNTPGQSHNFHFTFELHTQFAYQPGQNFSFTGDDDVFVFINNQLVIDLGGVHAQETASVDLSTLGLLTGQNYNLDIFFAERHTVASTFNFTTSIPLVTMVPLPPAVTGGVLGLAGVGGLGLARRRRA